MKINEHRPKLTAFIRRLMPDSNDEERAEAQSRFIRYLDLVYEIQQRLESEKEPKS